MSDIKSKDALRWTPHQPTLASASRPIERLFAFVRASDQERITCQVRFHGDVYGWEVQFLERGDLWYSRGGFVNHALAVEWADHERQAMER